MLNDEQRQRALEVMQEYLSAPPTEGGATPVQVHQRHDQERIDLIENQLKPLINGYLSGSVSLPEFKSKVDGINKRHPLWGFKGIKGQMFFNMVVNVADDPEECDQELKAALAVPDNEPIASSRIKTFASYVKRLREQWEASGNSLHGAPKMGSIPFFLSYFWQVQDRSTWPVYYTNSVHVMGDLNLWQPSEDLADSFLAFTCIHKELAALFSKESDIPFDFYMVEHIFWFRGGNPFEGPKPEPDGMEDGASPIVPTTPEGVLDMLPESYVPPIISIIPRLSRNDPGLSDAAKKSGTSVERAFEKSVHAALTMLGFESTLLGQGKGRVPDGRATAPDDGYAIIWDTKARAQGYSMGTDDRTIREYTASEIKHLKKKGPLKNIYYVIVSSRFLDDFDDTIRQLKMGTEVSEVILMEAESLVTMVDAKLRAPHLVPLGGPDGLQRLFTSSGILTAQMVREQFSESAAV